MSYLEQFDDLAAQPAEQVSLVSRWLRTDARPFFAELRAERPILVTPAFTLVARCEDVMEVLAREQDFSVRLYAARMDPVVAGPFMLARDGTPVNWRERGIMQAVLRPEDLPRVRAMAGEFADEALDAAAPDGRIEVVDELGRYVPIRVCGAYFGFPGPDLESMYRWSRATQADMFKNLADDPSVHEASLRAGEEMRAYLRLLLAEKRGVAVGGGGGGAAGLRAALSRLLAAAREHAGGRPRPDPQSAPQDVFSRLVRTSFPEELGFDDERILANVAGLLIGSGETSSQAIAQVLRQLLMRDRIREEAVAAAASPDTSRFDAYVWEALRLDPINPLLFRFTERETTIAAGTPRETTIGAGSIVFALTASAMSDETRVDRPDDFVVGRTDVPRLEFGHGHHSCLGRYVGAELIPEVVRRVLLRPGARLLPSPEGDLDFRGGPFPERFVIAFDPAPGAARSDVGADRVAAGTSR